MDISTANESSVQLVKLKGRFDAQCSDMVDEALQAVFEADATRVLVDMTAVDYISSTGLRVLLNAAKNAKTHNASLALCCLDPYVFEVFEVAGFNTIFDIYPDQPAALQALTTA